MLSSSSLNLRSAKPSDRPHLLVWDTPDEVELQQIALYNNAQRVNYRQNLLSRVKPGDRFLVLHQYLDRELNAISSIGASADKPIVLLEGLDCFITYLYVQPASPISLFWQKITDMRHLESLLWILLPSKLVHDGWAETRCIRRTSIFQETDRSYS